MTDILEETLISFSIHVLHSIDAADSIRELASAKAQILKHYRSVEDIEKAIGEDDKDVADKLYPESSSRFVRETHRKFFEGKNQLRVDIREKLGVLK